MHFLQFAYAQFLVTWQHGRAITNCPTALSSSHSVSFLYRVASGDCSVDFLFFVNAATTILIEIWAENFQLEQVLSEINKLNILSLSLSPCYSTFTLLPYFEFSRPHIAVFHYRWLRSPTRVPLATINRPFSKSVHIESS